ncbi:MAG TPA: twin-arginine translocase TatA/TatE family subunit [Planktothrix sp.]|jgi:sec-independent protein translocase protein TatA
MLGSPIDIAIVAGVILIVFGPKKVPELGKALGQGIGNFKKALHEAGDEMKSAADAVTHEKPADQQQQQQPQQQPVPAAAGATATSGNEASAPAKEEAAPPA